MSTSAETLAFHVEGPRCTELEALRSKAHIAFERTRDDLAARKKTLVLVYIYHFVFFCKTLGGVVESKNTNFVMSRFF
jgi:hypothetical protein